MTSVLAYRTASAEPVAAPTPKQGVNAVLLASQRAAARRREAQGLAQHDPAYGVWACLCICRRCIPFKDDHGGCVEGGCEPQFITRARLRDHNESFGGFSPTQGILVRTARAT